jgi:hypothetical protein
MLHQPNLDIMAKASSKNNRRWDVLSTAEIDNFLKQVGKLGGTQLRQLSDFLYGTLAPTLLSNRLVPHELTYLYALFLFIKMWQQDPGVFRAPTIRHFLDLSMYDNLEYYYFDDTERRKYIREILDQFFNLLQKNASAISPSACDN